MLTSVSAVVSSAVLFILVGLHPGFIHLLSSWWFEEGERVNLTVRSAVCNRKTSGSCFEYILLSFTRRFAAS